MPNRNRVAEWFWALTPVALRAPSVSAQNHGQPQGRKFLTHQDKENQQTS